MSMDAFHDALREALWIAVKLSAPLLSVALITGIMIGLFQALTSIQEMTLTFVPKLAAMLVVFWVSMTWMTVMLIDWFQNGIIPLVAGGMS